MSYRALYRRFRPETFDDLVGQENVVTILKNQIKTDNIAHAYLFSGIRGTGKTSAAKVFARAVNCLDPQDGNPCNKCEICRGILDENIMDVVELDAASNNKVEDIRELKENSNYPPSKARYKVYIVDEVHMLSKGAFNAFLKTLEEPPSYVIFILATTEEQRLPATILSRCQRYEFKRIPNDIIVENMRKITSEIGIEAEESALSLIARNSEGAMRDALSILDQCLSNVENTLTEADVIESIGSVDTQFLREITGYILKKDTSNVIEMFDTMMKSGKDIKVFLKELTSYFRNIMIVKSGANYRDFLELSDDEIDEMEKMVQDMSISDIVNGIDILNEAEQKIKYSTQPRTVMEITLIRLSEHDRVSDLMARIEKLEEMISSGAVMANAKRRSSSMGDSGNLKSSTDTKTMDAAELARSIKVSNSESSGRNTEAPERRQQKAEDINTEAVVTADNASDADVSNAADSESVSGESEKANITSEHIMEEWQSCMDALRKAKPATHALIMEGEPVSYKNNQMTISFGPMFGFHKEAVERPANKDYIEKFISGYFGTEIVIRTIMEGDTVEEQDKTDETQIEDVLNVFGKDKVIIE